jgi:hypothetical protein
MIITKQKSTISYSVKSFFDTLEGLHFTSLLFMKTWMVAHVKRISTNIKEQFSLFQVIKLTITCLILVTAIYIRFYDAIINAAPPLSDSYVTLAWMKYIDARELFHDGIYPQGFHIYLSTLYKFAAIDGLFILRYTGPLNAVFIMMGIYFCVKKWAGTSFGALVAAALYGCFPFVMEWFPLERQVGTNSQEFAFVFIFPTLYFLIKYCLTNNSSYLSSGIAGTAVIGLVHTFAFVFIGLLIGLLIICYFFMIREFNQTVSRLVGYSLLTVVLAVIPMGVGRLLGKEFHSSSVEYLLSQSTRQVYPNLVFIDYFVLAILGMSIVVFLFKKTLLSRDERFVFLFTVLAGSLTFMIYYFGGVLSNSVLITSRSLELWGLMVPFSIGICLSYLSKPMKRGKKRSYILFLVSIFLLIFLLNPKPIIGYKLEHNANIEQYLKIRNKEKPKTWLLVSNDEGYSVVLGTGFHMHISDFIAAFDPKFEALTRVGNSEPDETIPPYIYILLEKNVFEVDRSNSVYTLLQPKYIQRQSDYKTLEKWLNEHMEQNHPVKIFYEDANIVIYRLEDEKAKEKLKKTIWTK